MAKPTVAQSKPIKLNKSKRFSPSMYLAYTFLILVSAIWLVPVLFGITTSFRSQTEVVNEGFRLLPVNWIVDNYVAILENTSSAPILQWIWNSIFISTTHTLLVIVVISITGYGYTRMKFKGRDVLFSRY